MGIEDDGVTEPGQIETPTETTEEDRDVVEAAEVARRAQYGQTGDMLDTTIGGLGGAGASGSGPDISTQSSPAPGNHADLAAGSR